MENRGKELLRVVVLTPVSNETRGQITTIRDGVGKVAQSLREQGVVLTHLFLDDAAPNLPDDFPIRVFHSERHGLARTIVEGYRVACSLTSRPDVIVKIDAQEHDPQKILEVVESFAHARADAYFLPVWYTVRGESWPPMKEVTSITADLVRGLTAFDAETILSIYNLKFPLGFQAYRRAFLEESILPKLEEALALYQKTYGVPATWGIDLLALIIASQERGEKVDFIWGGWATPWEENRTIEKVEDQKKRARAIMALAKQLGYPKSKG